MSEESSLTSSPRSLTANDIYHREFRRVFVGGYAVREVDDFLGRVADAFEALAEQLKYLQERDREQREQLAELRQMEDTLRNTLVTSQKFSENIIDTAKREAEALREEARLLKAQSEYEATVLPEEILADIKQLQDRRERLRNELLSVIQTHRDLLDRQIPAEERVAESLPTEAPPEPPSVPRETPSVPPAGAPFQEAGTSPKDNTTGPGYEAPKTTHEEEAY